MAREKSAFIFADGMKIRIYNHQKKVKINLRWLKHFAHLALLECLKLPAHNEAILLKLAAIEVVIVSDGVISNVHRRFLNDKTPTDVITFDHGEIVISADTAQMNAIKFKRRLEKELGLYITHGLLHLNGFTDKIPAETLKMKQLQNKILKKCCTIS